MADDVRVWLVERDFDDKGMFRLVYATPDGEHQVVRERAAARIAEQEVTAAIDADADDLVPVEDEKTRERYAGEVDRIRENYAADETV